jgi:iron-sulfur cluster repair protein YtfE (RIC family)
VKQRSLRAACAAMSDVSGSLSVDHRECDAAFVAVEEAIAAAGWGAAAEALRGFRRRLLQHLAREEQVLFPAFEEAIGTAQGPTAVMRMEHEQMRALIEQLEAACSSRDKARGLGLCESLMVLMQQHNMKEEQVLYALMDESLGGEAARLLASLPH